MISRTALLAATLLVGASAQPGGWDPSTPDENWGLGRYGLWQTPVCYPVANWAGVTQTPSTSSVFRPAGANDHKNKTKDHTNKNTSPSSKNFNCGYCRKKAVEVAQCVSEAANTKYGSTEANWAVIGTGTNQDFYTWVAGTSCADGVYELITYCHGGVDYTDADTSPTVFNPYIVAWSGFPCNDGPLLTYAPVQASVATKDVKKLTCKVCNGVAKSVAKCVAGENYPLTLSQAQVSTGDIYTEIYLPCLESVGVLAENAHFCSIYECAVTVDSADAGKIIGWSGYSKILASLASFKFQIDGLLTTNLPSTELLRRGVEVGFTCSPITGAFLRNPNSDKATTYISRVGGAGSYSKYAFP